MSTEKKQERDFTSETDTAIAEANSIVGSGKLHEAVDKLLALEKQTRNAADLKSTTRLLSTIANLCMNARDFVALNSNITLLSKKHGQLKEAIRAMVEEVMGWLDRVKQEGGEDKWLELLKTLREVSEGKIFLETPRARVTLILSHYHERLSHTSSKTRPPITGTSTPAPSKSLDSLQTACDLLTELQVETYSSMERKEKTEFLLEQMRLLVAVARAKDQEAKELKAKGIKEAKGIVALDGEREWVKVRVGGRKVHEGFLAEKGNEELKLKYYQLMIQYALHGDSYLEAAKYFYKVWNTPSIKEDVDGKGREALENIAYYIVLAPYENEQSDMLNRLFTDPALERLELQYNLVKCFITRELMRWPGIENIYGPTLRKTAVFIKGDEGDKRWEDLHTRVIEHNIRVVSQYYTRITIARLTSLLDLTQKETEVILCKLVVSGSVYARIDRPAGIIDFRQKKTAEDIMNDWASDVSKLIGLVEKTWMGMNVALANKAASS